MKKIKWKYDSRVNVWQGTIKGDFEPLIFIDGNLCITDLRESRKSSFGDNYISPKHYKVIGLSLEEKKQLAEDLVTGNNFELHEQNRLQVVAESEKTVRLIEEADAFLKKLKERNNE
jgi:hypothetical protein